MGKVIAVVSGKGGVGKSTVTVGLGRALSENGKRVLLVDCDAGLRCLDKLTGIAESLVYDILDAIEGKCAVNEAVYNAEGYESLFVLPASMGDVIPENLLTPFIEKIKEYYDYVIMDSPAGLGEGFISAVKPSDTVLVVCNSDPISAASANIVREVTDKFGVKEKRLIINRFNSDYFRKLKAASDLDSIIDITGLRLLGLVPEDPSLISQFLKGDKIKGKSETMMALRRIASRLQGNYIPFPFV